MKKAMISPKNLKILRERKNWSQQELENKSKVTSRTILAIEKSDDEAVSVQHKTLSGLSKALGERADVLSGKAPLPEEGKPYDLHIQLSPQVRLNFDLIKKKYGVDIMDVINVAPLLFVASAEESLQRQQEKVEKESEEFGKLSISAQDRKAARRFLPGIPEDYTPEEYFAGSRHAIKNKDLFEWEFCVPHMYDEGNPRSAYPNPFADFLYEVSQRPLLKGTIEFEDVREPGPLYWYSYSECIPDHRICLDTLRQVTLGSKDAEKALEEGVVSISQITKEMWEPCKAGERVAWLEGEYRQSKAKEEDEPA